MGVPPLSEMSAARARGRTGPRWPGVLPVLSLFGAAASLVAIRISSNQGHDLIAVLMKLGAFFAVLAVVSIVARGFSPAGTAIGARLDAIAAALERHLRGRRAAGLVAGMMLAYAAAWSVLSILRHQALNSSGFDLAIQHQVIWNLAHGRGFAESIEVSNYLGDHVCLTMPVFAPLLWLWNDVRILLIAQSVVLALGAWPLYRLARRRAGPLEGVIWSAVYLLTPAIGFMNKFDFHEVVLAVPILLAGIDTVDEGRFGRAAIWLALAAATREEIGIAVAAMAVGAIFARGRRAWGGIVAILALAWSVFALYWVIPHFRGGIESDTLARYGWLGGTPSRIARTLLTRPWALILSHYHRVRRVLFPVQLLWPMAGLPLAAPALAVLALPSLALSLMSSNISQNSIFFQYNAPILPILFWAAVEGSRRLRRSGASRGWILAGVLFSLLCANWADPAAVKSVPRPYAIVDGIRPRPNRAAFARAARLIPPDAELLAENDLAPHFSARTDLHIYNPRKAIPDADWVILDVTDTRHIDSNLDLACGAIALVTHRGYRVRFYRDGILVLCRSGEEDPGAVAAFRDHLAGLGLTLSP